MFTSIYQKVTTLAELKAICKNTWIEMGDYFVGYWEYQDDKWRWSIHTGDEETSRDYLSAANFLRHQPEIARMLREGETVRLMYVMDNAFAQSIYDLTDQAT